MEFCKVCKYVPTTMFSHKHDIESITIPEGVVRIMPGAFEGCINLKSVSLPKSLKFLEKKQFAGCSMLETISIPDGIRRIPEYAFHGCTNLTSVSIPASVVSIGHSAFAGCTMLKSISIPDGVKEIESYTFKDCSSLEFISIPDSVTNVRICSIEGCTNLLSVRLPEHFSKRVENIMLSINRPAQEADDEKKTGGLHLDEEKGVLALGQTEISIGELLFYDTVIIEEEEWFCIPDDTYEEKKCELHEFIGVEGFFFNDLGELSYDHNNDYSPYEITTDYWIQELRLGFMQGEAPRVLIVHNLPLSWRETLHGLFLRLRKRNE